MHSASFLSSAPVTIQFVGQFVVFLSKQCCAPIFLMVWYADIIIFSGFVVKEIDLALG
jgi:hypothetical protein